MLTQESLLCVNTKLQTMELLERVVCFHKMKKLNSLVQLHVFAGFYWFTKAASCQHRQKGCWGPSEQSLSLHHCLPFQHCFKAKRSDRNGVGLAGLGQPVGWVTWEGTFQPYFCNLPWKKVRSPCYYKKNAIFQSQFFLTFLFYRKKSFSWVLLNLNQLYHFQAQDQNPLFGLSSSKLETLKLSSLSEIDI